MKNFLFVLVVFILCACSSTKENPRKIFLIHGAHLNNAVWVDLETILMAGEYDVYSANLMNLERPMGLKELAKEGCAQAPHNAYWLAHSQAGAIANQMIKYCRKKAKGIIYLAAVVPLPGERPFDLLSKQDETNYLKGIKQKGNKYIISNLSVFWNYFAQDLIRSHKKPTVFHEFTELAGSALNLEQEQFDAIPKYYIETKLDKIISLDSQRAYIQRTKFKKVFGIVSGHLPMLSRPDHLKRVLDQIIE